MINSNVKNYSLTQIVLGQRAFSFTHETVNKIAGLLSTIAGMSEVLLQPVKVDTSVIAAALNKAVPLETVEIKTVIYVSTDPGSVIMLAEVMEETATIIETDKLNLGFTSDKENKSRIKGEVDTKPVETVDSVKESFISDFAVNVVEKYETENVLSEENNSDQICQHEVKDTTKIVDETEDMVESIMSKSINSSSGLQENVDNEDDSIFLIEIEGIGEMQLRVVNNKVSVGKSPKLEKTTTETEQLCPTVEIENNSIPQELLCSRRIIS